MPDLHYIHPRLAAIYDVTCGWSKDRSFYLNLAGKPDMAILDLGCGTGIMARAYAENGHRVTGVDPAMPMLDVARTLPFGDRVYWICASAETLRLGRTFDLIIMTGNAFQVFLEDDDVLAVLTAMQIHLNHGGRIVFETRNPAMSWESRWNTDAALITTNGQAYREKRNVVSRTGSYIHFATQYIFSDETLTSDSVLRFHSADGLKALVQKAGLEITALSGDWDGEAFDPENSEEMVFVLRLPAP